MKIAFLDNNGKEQTWEISEDELERLEKQAKDRNVTLEQLILHAIKGFLSCS